MDPFNKPHLPIGYVAFDFDTKSFRGRYNKLETLRKFFIEHNVKPEDVVVFRVFEPDLEDSDRKLMSIEEYAFPHTDYECFSTGDCIEHQSWKWTPQLIKNSGDAKTNIFADLKNSIVLFIYNTINLIKGFI